jgi:D-alanine-D-alanine ligase
MMRKYGGALIEEFIEGTECTVLVAENPDDPQRPITYTPIQYRFPEGETFKHHDVKWVDYEALQCAPVEDPVLEAHLRQTSADFFLGLSGAGYGRCDMRVDADGRPFMLEINANCGIYYPPKDAGSADLCLMNDPAGHEGFTRRIVAAALARSERRARGWEVRPHPGGQYGLHATRRFEPGERIIRFEEQPHTLVTLSHIERNWPEARLSWLRRYAWPLTDEIYVVWSRDPEDWKPVNHACEPTAWLEGLDVAARLAMEPGDEITLDYATLFNERMPSFSCRCGAPACRGTIHGDDYRQEFVSRYGDHVSDYVRRRRGG